MARKTVKEIDFETLKNYWIEVDHFKDPNKRIVEVIKYLGPHTTPYHDPRRIAYGLYDNDKLIGATQLVQWEENRVRYRTLNVREEYRGEGFGWFLLASAYERDWKGCGKLFGWIRDTHYNWAKVHGFVEIDDKWTNDHIAMERKM
jgi:GNAT superfamily N-acetyltransferase